MSELAMISIKIPSLYQPFTEWKSEFKIQADTVGDALRSLLEQVPNLYPHLYTHWGILTANVLIYLNDDEVFTLQGLDTPLKTGDALRLIPTISGG
jgi:molybdopterin converting factor small subunit